MSYAVDVLFERVPWCPLCSFPSDVSGCHQNSPKVVVIFSLDMHGNAQLAMSDILLHDLYIGSTRGAQGAHVFSYGILLYLTTHYLIISHLFSAIFILWDLPFEGWRLGTGSEWQRCLHLLSERRTDLVGASDSTMAPRFGCHSPSLVKSASLLHYSLDVHSFAPILGN